MNPVMAMAKVIQGLEGAMPESFRTLVAHRAATGFLAAVPLEERNKEDDQAFADAFHRECKLKSNLPFVNHDLQLTDSDLATFCNRWMALEKYEAPDGTWQPFSAEMNQVRYTMCKELQGMQGGPRYNEQLETD